MKYDYNSEVRQSARLGHGHAYINQIRQNNNDKYCYIKALSQTGYFEDGYHRYRIVRTKILEDFLERYIFLVDRRWISALERDLHHTPFTLHRTGTRLLGVNKVTWKLMRELELMIPKIDSFIERRTKHGS